MMAKKYKKTETKGHKGNDPENVKAAVEKEPEADMNRLKERISKLKKGGVKSKDVIGGSARKIKGQEEDY